MSRCSDCLRERRRNTTDFIKEIVFNMLISVIITMVFLHLMLR